MSGSRYGPPGYALPDYGTGAILAVSAHDQRDLDCVRVYGLDMRVVVDTGREAAEALTVLVSVFAPYTSEETREVLGHKPSVSRAAWPAAVPSVLTQDKITCVVQVNGKVRDKLEVSPEISEDDLRELALVAPGVVWTLGDQQVRRVIVRAPKAGQHRRGVTAQNRCGATVVVTA